MHLKRSNSNLSLRPRRSFTDVSSPATLQHQDEEETTDQQRLLSKEEATVLSGFDDWDDGDGDPDHQGHYRQTDMRSVWRFIMIGACIGFGFLIFKVVVLKYGHSAESMKHHHGVEQLFDNGTALFGPTLILVSLDGFRNDYLQRGVTPHLAKLAANGISAEYMKPSFPSITFPNHWTLATGLYPEAHGIVGNEFYDPVLKKQFIHKVPAISSTDEWWGGEPIWTTSSTQGKRSAVVMWPGSPVQRFKPDYLWDYERSVTADQKMDAALNWLDMPFEERPQMIAVYVPQIDQKGHGGGPQGKQLNSVLSQMDDAVGHLMDGLKARNLDSHVHVVVVSDHGMAATDKSRLIFYEDILSKESLSFLREREVWPLLNLRPKDDAPPHAIQQVYKELSDYAQRVGEPHFQVYLREDVPERFHYSHNERIAPVVMIPDVGYAIVSHKDYDIHSDKDYRPRGIHGYDNEALEMRAIFMAQGPRVEKHWDAGTVLPPFYNVEVYGFVSKILNLDAAPNNGTGLF